MRAAGYRGPSIFTRPALRLISDASEGLTRRVNVLSDKALLAAFAAGTHAVTPREVKRAIADSDFYRPARKLAKYSVGAGALSAALALGWGLHALLAGPAPMRPGGATAAPPQTAPGTVSAKTERGPDAARRDNLSVTGELHVPVTAPKAKRSGGQPGIQGPRTLGELTRERFEATQERLRTAPGDRHAIQLLTVEMRELSQLEDFLLKAAKVVPREDLLVYSVKFDGRQHYRAAYGSYSDAKEALAAMNTLPLLFRAQSPYPRSFERMRSQNHQ
jgi:hypothetical protein